MKRAPSHSTPLWVNDSHPEWWHPLPVAAKFYFKKSASLIRLMAARGYLADIGVATYFDGTRWYVRVPLESFPAKTAKCANCTTKTS